MGLLGWTVRRWQASLTYEGLEAGRDHFRRSPHGSLILIWHNRLLPGIGALREIGMADGRLCGLVSASRDGGKLSAFMRSLGIEPVRGSSSRRGSHAARQLTRLLRRGNHVAITMDGPRGPCYCAHAGAAALWQLTRVPVCLAGVEVEEARELNSWDRFLLPLPGSRVRLLLRHIPQPPVEGTEREGVRLFLEQELRRLTPDRHRGEGNGA